MSAKHSIPQTDPSGQDTQTKEQPNIKFMVEDGPHYSPDYGEWEIWENGEVIAYASTQQAAWRIYHEALATHREHVERNPANAEAERDEQSRSVLLTINGQTSILEIEPTEDIPFMGEPCYPNQPRSAAKPHS